MAAADAPHLSLDLDDLEPVSEIRPVPATGRRLVVDTGLRGAAAEQAWVTVVTDDADVVLFEGAPSADGCVAIAFEQPPFPDRVCVQLETARSHRQAKVTLRDGWNAHAFA
jgi:hypothetical protein